MSPVERTEVLRHDLLFRAAHWSIFVEGGLLVLTGFQLGGILGGTFLPLSTATFHVLIGIAFMATAAIYGVGIVTGGDYRWVSLRRIPYSLRFIIMETRGWFGFAPKPANPIAYDAETQEYAEKLVPSVIVVFWSFLILGVVLSLTGLALTFPQSFWFVFAVTDLIGSVFTGVTGMAFMLTFHRLVTFILVALVMMHIYASFIFKLVGSMITGKRNERVAPTLAGRERLPTAGSGIESAGGKTVVIGLGNRYMKDDGIGIQVAEQLERSLGGDVVVEECQSVDIGLLAKYGGASKIILVDASKSGFPPGTISKYGIAPSKTPLVSLEGQHALQLHDMVDVANQAGLLSCPVTVVGVEPKDCGPGEGLTPELERAVPDVIETVRELALS